MGSLMVVFLPPPTVELVALTGTFNTIRLPPPVAVVVAFCEAVKVKLLASGTLTTVCSLFKTLIGNPPISCTPDNLHLSDALKPWAD